MLWHYFIYVFYISIVLFVYPLVFVWYVILNHRVLSLRCVTVKHYCFTKNMNRVQVAITCHHLSSSPFFWQFHCFFDCFLLNVFISFIIIKETNQNTWKWIDLVIKARILFTIKLSILIYSLSNKLSVSSLIWVHFLFIISCLF